MNDIPDNVLEKLKKYMTKACISGGGGLHVGISKCESSEDHFHIMICPTTREICLGPKDGEQTYTRLSVDVNKMAKAFDKRPEIVFDTALGESCPNICASGEILGIGVDVSVMSYPPDGLSPVERVYGEGPKKGVVENIKEPE